MTSVRGLTRGAIAAVAAAIGALALAAAPANAGTVVWAKGTTEIWAMLDDGSYAAPIASASALGMRSLGDPHVAPNGEIVVFDGSTNQFLHNVSGTIHCGFNCTGVYRWEGGQAVRLSGPPSNGDGEVTTYDHQPEIAHGGRYVYSFLGCIGIVGSGYSCDESISSERLDGTDHRPYGGYCSDGPTSPSANPANPAEVAYVGCWDANGDPGLWVSGENNTNTRLVGASDVPIEDPSWRSDGEEIVHLELGGATPGIWVVKATGTPGFRHALAAPADSKFRSPRFMGAAQDRILFSAAGELWTIPASCTAQTCSFPASATKLTTGGDNATPAWTARNLIAPPSQGGGNQGGGDQGGGGQGGGSEGGGQPTRPSFSVPKVKLAAALKKGLTTTVQTGEPGRVTAVLREGRTKVGSGSVRTGKTGKARLKVKFTSKAARKLRRKRSVRLTLVVTFKPTAGGQARKTTRTFTIKR